MSNINDLQRGFWNNIEKTDQCWWWRGPITSKGFGQVSINKKLYAAHRLSWEIHFGEIPDGTTVKQTCQNILCVRPDHLVLGHYGYQATAPEDRFWNRVTKTDYCWLWTGGTNAYGYGKIMETEDIEQYRDVLVHRLSWEIHNGPIPEGLDVLHKCDNRPCVNPDHLFLGTIETNMEDKMLKGRQAKGEMQGASKLNRDQVREIRRRLKESSVSREELAQEFGVSRATIRGIDLLLTWTWLDEGEVR